MRVKDVVSYLTERIQACDEKLMSYEEYVVGLTKKKDVEKIGAQIAGVTNMKSAYQDILDYINGVE